MDGGVIEVTQGVLTDYSVDVLSAALAVVAKTVKYPTGTLARMVE